MAESFDLSVMPMKAESSFLLISNEDDDVKPMLLVSETPPPVPEHVNHFLTIQMNLKAECDDLECEEDPLLVLNPDEDEEVLNPDEDEDVSSNVKSECQQSPSPSARVSDEVSGKCFVIHTGKKVFHCYVCGMSFSQMCSLKAHRLTHTHSHTGQTPYKCDSCGKYLSTVDILARHKLLHGKIPYKCDICGKCFALRSTLTNHRLIHTGQKSFHCDVCGKGFNQQTHLATHRLTAHTVLECDWCGQCFRRSNSLERHRMTHNGEKLQRQKYDAGSSEQKIGRWGMPRLLRRP